MAIINNERYTGDLNATKGRREPKKNVNIASLISNKGSQPGRVYKTLSNPLRLDYCLCQPHNLADDTLRKPFRCFNTLVKDVIYYAHRIYEFNYEFWYMELEHCIVPLLPREMSEWGECPVQCKGFVMFSKDKWCQVNPHYYWRTQKFCFCKPYNRIKNGIENYQCTACTCGSDEEDEALPENVMGPMCECIKSCDVIMQNIEECERQFRHYFDTIERQPAPTISSEESGYLSEEEE